MRQEVLRQGVVFCEEREYGDLEGARCFQARNLIRRHVEKRSRR